MAYTPSYTQDDLGPIAVDGIGTAGVTVIGFVVLITLVALAVWFMKKKKQLK